MTSESLRPGGGAPICSRPCAAPSARIARARQAVEQTVEYAMSRLGEEAWAAGMNPDIPETNVLDNPYTYTDYESGSTRGRQP